jgi:Lrp/AsnC family leucine-responsive transcriptional regulator
MDETDRRILLTLQCDGRLTNAGLAEAIGLSPSATLERVRRLERDGAIHGYRAVVDPVALGLAVQAFVGVRLRVHDGRSIEQFEQRVADVESVVSCTHVTGQFDYLLHVAVRDLTHLRETIRVDLAAIPGVAKFDTMLGLAHVKVDTGWPGTL